MIKKKLNQLVNWLKEHKQDILIAYTVIISALFIVFTIVLMLFMVMCEDLVNRVKTQEYELNKVTTERNYYSGLYDSILQDYENCVPMQQYIDDVEYLETVIRDIRDQD